MTMRWIMGMAFGAGVASIVLGKARQVNAGALGSGGALLALIVLALPLSAQDAVPGPKLRRFESTRVQMGSPFRLVAYGADEEKVQKALAAAQARVAKLNDHFSDYDVQSEVMKLCRGSRPGKAYPLSEPLASLIGRSLELSKATNGAFDITIGPCSRLWRKTRKLKQLPPKEVMERAMKRVGWQKLALDPKARTLRFQVAEMRLDFGGIAKGLAADEALRVLTEAGYPRALVDAGGDLRLGQAPPGEKGWKVAVRSLSDEERRPPLLLKECAIATSGDLEKVAVVEGVEFSHLIDPKTGLGLTQRRAATVIAPDGATADALASALCVLGVEGLKIVGAMRGVEAEVHWVAEGKRQRKSTTAFPE